MPKWDKTRNYYADLELQPSASSDEIKRQFKKLALKYHPDRNPGREAEVNPKFQVIQSAHEILTDETLKRQYDEARRTYTSRYPGASGVKGNPWQDAAKAYPPPPRRQPTTQARPTSGAQRYENFASSMPRNPRPHTPKDDPQFRRSTAEAWDHIRPSASRRNTQTRPTTPGRAPPGRAPTSATRDSRPGPAPVPPRTAYQKQKQEAAFGTSKKTGFTPRSANVADEPPVTNKNYFTNRTHSNLFTEPEATSEGHSDSASAAADLFAPFRDKFMDNRQRTPYHTPGGERTSLFDSNPGLGRSTSTRTPPRSFEMPGSFPRARPRSSSPARSSSNDGGSEDSIKINPNINGATTSNNTSAQSRASERYKPKTQPVADTIPLEQPTASDEPLSSSTTAQPNGSGPSVYASQTLPNYLQSQSTTTTGPSRHRGYANRWREWPRPMKTYRLSDSSSEGKKLHDFNTLLPVERDQRRTLDQLVKKYSMTDGSNSGNRHFLNDDQSHPSPNITTSYGKVNADGARVSSFGFHDRPNTAGVGTGYSTFARNSTENINTRFVDDEMADDWQFKAGSVSANEATTPSKTRPQSRNRPTARKTPLSKPPLPTRMPQGQELPDDVKAGSQRFSAGAWNEQIGPQHFEPQSSNSTSTSPTRRANLRKSRTFKMTAGTAAVVDEESESPLEDPDHPFTVPDAMDIDTPPTEKTRVTPKSVQANSARPYFAEPHRPDWRAGDINGVASKTAGLASGTDSTKEDSSTTNGTQPAVNVKDHPQPKHVGSEDTEEFHSTFSDFKKVEPFMEPPPSGLGSFADLKSNLPFTSQPSEHIPLDNAIPPGGLLEFPPPPVAPRLPPTMGVAGLRPNNSSFKKYAQDFNNYVEKWEAFNNKVLAHFSTRQEEFKLRRLRRGANWLEDGVPNYIIEMDQDLDVQKKYLDACAEHRKRLAEYMDFRDRVR
ncbi:hypothetical protein F5Y09DRAFT_141050 [Xylaria sp. FL1042]|nr:hypothetical protein F5Y09DRAFT_141050 [Xylaria sp. FL1042]